MYRHICAHKVADDDDVGIVVAVVF
jgi:hypothetical protein